MAPLTRDGGEHPTRTTFTPGTRVRYIGPPDPDEVTPDVHGTVTDRPTDEDGDPHVRWDDGWDAYYYASDLAVTERLTYADDRRPMTPAEVMNFTRTAAEALNDNSKVDVETDGYGGLKVTVWPDDTDDDGSTIVTFAPVTAVKS